MATWKTDPLYRLVFREVDQLWQHLQLDAQHGVPEALRIEEHSSSDWEEAPHSATLKDVWIHDQFGLRLFPGLRRVPHEFGEPRGDTWQFPLVRFSISPDRSQVAFAYEAGADRRHDVEFSVEGTGDLVQLHQEEGSLSGSF